YMLDGLPIDAFVEPQSLSVNAFERIELQRGPASVLYPNYLSMDFSGNQSPLTGTTNIILKEHIDQEMTEVEAHYGSYNTAGGGFYHQQNADNLHLFIGGDYETSDYSNYGTNPSWLNMLGDPEYEKNKFYFKSTLYINDNDTHKVSLFVQHTAHDGDAGRLNRDFKHRYWTINGDYALPIRDDLTANLKLGYRSYERKWEEDNYPENLALASEDSVEQDIVPVDLYLSYDHLEGAVLTAGTDYQTVTYKTFSEADQKIANNDADASQYGLYLQEELPFSDFLFRAGVRYSYTRHDISQLSGVTPGNDEESWDEVIYSFGTRYHLNSSVDVFANVGTSFVAPSLKSVGGTINMEDKGVAGYNGQLPNPDLKPERGTGYDVGVDIAPLDRLSISARGFLNVVDDQIVQIVISDDPSQSQDINAGDTTTYGVELEVKHKPFTWLNSFANYTYTYSEISNDTDPDQDGTEVPFVPEHMGNIGATVQMPMEMELSVYLHLAGNIYDGNSRASRTKFNSYELLNVNLKKTLIQKTGYKVDAYMDLYNLTNNQFKMPWQYQDPGFCATAGVKVTL
ncbi:MAG: TonB-dependent receptor, partial [Desulfobacteraceae bacterium]